MQAAKSRAGLGADCYRLSSAYEYGGKEDRQQNAGDFGAFKKSETACKRTGLPGHRSFTAVPCPGAAAESQAYAGGPERIGIH